MILIFNLESSLIHTNGNYKYYALLKSNNGVFKMDDYIMIEREPQTNKKYAQIHCIYVDTTSDTMTVEIKWIYGQTDSITRPYHGYAELFDSNDFESFSSSQISSIPFSACKIESFKTFINRTNFPDNVYYISDFDYYDVKTNKLCKRSNNSDYECSEHKKIVNKHFKRMSLDNKINRSINEDNYSTELISELSEDLIIKDLEVMENEESIKRSRISKKVKSDDIITLDLSSDSDELDSKDDERQIRTTPRKNVGRKSKLEDIKEKIQSFPTVNNIDFDDDIIIDDFKPDPKPVVKREYSKDDWLASVEFKSKKRKKSSIIDSNLPNSTRLNLERVKSLSDRSKNLNNFSKWDFDKETRTSPKSSPIKSESKTYIQLNLNSSILSSTKRRKTPTKEKKKKSAKILPIKIEGIQHNSEDTKDKIPNQSRNYYNDSQEYDPEMSDFIVEDDAPLSQYDDGLEDEDELLSQSQGNEEFIHQSQDEVSSYLNHVSLVDSKTAYKIYIQYLISSILEPGFSDDLMKNNDSYFIPALKKIKNSILDMKQIVVASSIWNREFKKDLDQLQNYVSHKIEPQESCDVCSRSNRISTYQVTLSGIRYDSNKFWDGDWNEYYEISNVDDSNIETVTYYMGRYCHVRTKLYHTLNHFQYKLTEKINNKLYRIKNDDRVTILEKILDDKKWIERRYREYEELKEMIDEFRSYAHKEDEEDIFLN